MYSNGRGGGLVTTGIISGAMRNSGNPALAVTGTTTLVLVVVALTFMVVGTLLTRLSRRG